MNKIDNLVKDLILLYTDTYSNRFDALATILTNGSYVWHNGELVYIHNDREANPPTIEGMLDRCKAKVKHEIKESKSDIRKGYSLNHQYIADAKRKLHDAKFIAKNLETYCTTFIGVNYRQTRAFLWDTHKRGHNQFWSLNNKPDNITEEWRAAIYGWLQHLVPTVNELYGKCDRNKYKWTPQDTYEEIFNWFYEIWELYKPPTDPVKEAQLRKMIDEILEEKNA